MSTSEIYNGTLYSTCYDLRFVPAALPGDVVVTDEAEITRARTMFEQNIAESKAWLEKPHFPPALRVENRLTETDVRCWLLQMQAECWAPERQVLVKRPVR